MHFDVVVAGGGAAGCAVAARLAVDDRITVGLLEAGPDHGPHDAAGWPPEMIDARAAPRTHDWEPDGPSCCSRARVIGGSSTHNGCWAVLPAPPDLEWNAWWTDAMVRPHVESAMRTLRVRPFEDRTAWHHAVVARAAELGLPELADVNAPSAGVGWVPLNAVGRLRWHAAFAYLDPVRPRVTVLGDTLAVRLEFSGDRATGVHVLRSGRAELITADRVVLCAGAYGNPPLLARSGVGAPSSLRELGVPVLHALPEVGRGLADHGGVGLFATARPALVAQPDDHVTQTLVKARSSLADEHWDLHLVPWSETGRAGTHVYVMDPVSRGTVRTTSLDPQALPVIDHGFFTDPDGRDERKLRDGVELARDLMKGLAEVDASPDAEYSGYWHPVGTCAMGPVTDHLGRLHGVENVHVADASVIPVAPRANTHVITVAVADRMATLLAQEWGTGR